MSFPADRRYFFVLRDKTSGRGGLKTVTVSRKPPLVPAPESQASFSHHTEWGLKHRKSDGPISLTTIERRGVVNRANLFFKTIDG